MNDTPTPTTRPSAVGVKLRTSTLLPRGAYALMRGEVVVWDSITGPFEGRAQPPAGGWDGMMVSVEDFETLKAAGS